MAIILNELEFPASDSNNLNLRSRAASILGIAEESINSVEIIKKSLDARKKSRIVYRYRLELTIEDENLVLSKNLSLATKAPDRFPHNPLSGLELSQLRFRHRPIVIGSGPAGTFAALTLSRAGIPVTVIERGETIQNRIKSVNRLRAKGELNPESNYCFGEGGAGTFSDGKLTCGKNHPLIRFVFEEFVKYGAPADILYEAHPHIGTDYLLKVALNMRQKVESTGSNFLFGKTFADFRSGGKSARFEISLCDGTVIPTDHLILAIGHSARDTYQLLLDRGIGIVPKPFAVGARFEHPQEEINRIQFGNCGLPAAEYKLASQVNDRGIWTFCMCPGGHLIPTSAQPGHLAINGMSYHSRNSSYANAAVVVNVRREDFYRGHPLDGMKFQQVLEQKAFEEGGGNYYSPAQRILDFMNSRLSKGTLDSTYKPGVNSARLDLILPEFITSSLKTALRDYEKHMRGFISPNALVVGVESKTSSPISMPRDSMLQSITHPGLFPTGEGAGFAGGIVSAALDGVRVAQAVLKDALSQCVAKQTSSSLLQ